MNKSYRLAPRRHKYQCSPYYVCDKCHGKFGNGRKITPTKCDECRGVDHESPLELNGRQNFLVEYLVMVTRRMAALEKGMEQDGRSPTLYGVREDELEWKILRFRENRVKQMLGMENLGTEGLRQRAGEASRMLSEIKQAMWDMSMRVSRP